MTVGSNSDSTHPAGRRVAPTKPEQDPEKRIGELLRQGETAARAGQRPEARRLFHEILAIDPTNEDAWLWLAYLAPSPRQGLAYLEQAQGYHPQSGRVRKAQAWLRARLAGDPAAPAMPRQASASQDSSLDEPAFVRRRSPRSQEPSTEPPAPQPASRTVRRKLSAAGASGARPTGPDGPAVRRREAAQQPRLKASTTPPDELPVSLSPQPQEPPAGRLPRLEVQPSSATRPTIGAPRRRLSHPAPQPYAPATPGHTMARPRAQGQTRPHPALILAGLTLAVVALLAVGLALSRRGRAPDALAAGAGTPTPGLILTPAADMATLRQQAELTISQENWELAIPVLERIYQLSPEDDGVRQQLAVAHLRFGLQLVDQDRIDDAIAHYQAAIRFYANDVDLQMALHLATAYRDGRQAVADQRWDDAAAILETVYNLQPGFRDVADLLVTAHLEQAKALESAGKLEEARAFYARVAAIKPDSQEAGAKLAELTRTLTPPTPIPTAIPAKRIEIDISEQRLRAYENDAPIFDWACSTGKVATPTQPGNYQVLDKIPEAWSSVWGLRMPYWLGIYWAGGSEDGIHALPIDRYGKTLWAGYLGHRASFGCIILDTPNAARLFDWADIGTPVIITE